MGLMAGSKGMGTPNMLDGSSVVRWMDTYL